MEEGMEEGDTEEDVEGKEGEAPRLQEERRTMALISADQKWRHTIYLTYNTVR